MLEFDAFGYLIPNSPIRSSIQELEQVFVIEYSSVQRSKLFDQYLSYTRNLKEIIGNEKITQWINGSFVTRSNPSPSDIDVVSFIDSVLVEKLGNDLSKFIFPFSKNNYPGVDAYLVEYSEDRDVLYQIDKAYWLHQFDKTRRNKRTGQKQSKGFLEIIV